MGSRDSEVALILEDQEFTEGQMNGKNFPRGKLAGKLRMDLMKGHLGFTSGVMKYILGNAYTEQMIVNTLLNTLS